MIDDKHKENYKPKGENLRFDRRKGVRQGKTTDLGRNHRPKRL
jgi:hypothetical protein